MKRILFILILLIAPKVYSQDIISLSTKYVYDFYDKKTYPYRINFVFDSKKLEIAEEDEYIGIQGNYNIVGNKEVYNNELGTLFHFFVEKKQLNGFEHIPSKQYVLTITEEYITFNLRSESTIDYLFMFDANY